MTPYGYFYQPIRDPFVPVKSLEETIKKRVFWQAQKAAKHKAQVTGVDDRVTVPNIIRILKHSGQKTLHYGASSTIASNFTSGEFIMVTFGEEGFARVPIPRASKRAKDGAAKGKAAKGKKTKKTKERKQSKAKGKSETAAASAAAQSATPGFEIFAVLGAAILDTIGAAPLEHTPKPTKKQEKKKEKKKKNRGDNDDEADEADDENDQDLEETKQKYSRKTTKKKGKKTGS